MRILGIDPGLGVTGYGIIELSDSHQPRLLEVGTIAPRAREPLPERLNKIYKNLEEILEQYKPDVMVVEKLYAHYKHPITACIMGHVRGVIVLQTAQHKIKLIEHSVKRIRKTLIGNGNATKQQTREAVCHILKIDPSQLTLDASDALALALGYALMQRFHSKTFDMR
jgi:crossover junction endodeoxyribonuclease RuvC